MTDREAMEQAQERLELWFDERGLLEDAEAIAALRERLAQPEPPVLTGIDCSCGKKWRILNNTLTASEPETVMAEYKFQTYAAYKTPDGEMKIGVVPDDAPLTLNGVPLYPRREWVGLTDEERNNLWRNIVGWGDPSHDDEDLMKAIEAKLKEKNT